MKLLLKRESDILKDMCIESIHNDPSSHKGLLKEIHLKRYLSKIREIIKFVNMHKEKAKRRIKNYNDSNPDCLTSEIKENTRSDPIR